MGQNEKEVRGGGARRGVREGAVDIRHIIKKQVLVTDRQERCPVVDRRRKFSGGSVWPPSPRGSIFTELSHMGSQEHTGMYKGME